MTPPPLSELSAEEINARVAETIMDYRWYTAESGHVSWLFKREDRLLELGATLGKKEGARIDATGVPDYQGSIDAAFEVEAAIERRGLEQLYAYLLTNLLGFPDEHYLWTYDNLWTMLHATPRQRCLAALSAVATRPADARGKD